jgi:hypothetical protein
LELTPFNDTADHTAATALHSISAGRRRSIASGSDQIGSLEPFSNPPNWLNETRAWRVGAHSSQGQWAIHMRMPIDPQATDVDGNNGLRLTDLFKMWYLFRIKTTTRANQSNTDISGGGVLRLSWPKNVYLTGGGVVYPDPSVADNYESCSFGSQTDPSCPANGGITIGDLDVGTTNSPSSYIDPANPNVFYAQPTNNGSSDVAKYAINATFRLANWGSVAQENAPWTTIQSGVCNSEIIPAGAKADATNDIRFNKDDMASVYPNVTAAPHQCMLVELSGAGLHFNPSSVYRNMDFIVNSKYSRTAEISVAGLKPIDKRPRDVYLAVETLNMPAKTSRDFEHFGHLAKETLNMTGTTSRDLGYFAPVMDLKSNDDRLVWIVGQAQKLIRERYKPHEHCSPEQRLDLLVAVLRAVGAGGSDLDHLFPTYRVHVYCDSGETWTVGGVTYPLLELQTSFGYHVYHEGKLIGFNHQLRGAIRVAKSFHVLRVPNNRSAKITTIIHGVSPDEREEIEKDEPIRAWPRKRSIHGWPEKLRPRQK